MGPLDDLTGKTVWLNGVPLPDRKNLKITATGATASDAESSKSTLITFPSNTIIPNAVGDGAADDTAVIQAALTEVGAAGGGAVELGPKHYRITAKLNLPKGVWFRGQGRAGTWLICDYSGDGVEYAGPIDNPDYAFCRVSDMRIITGTHLPPNEDTAGNATGAGVVFRAGIYCLAERLEVRGFRDGIVFDQAELSDALDCNCEFNLRSAFWLTNGDDRTVGADAGFTNRISIQRVQMNSSQYGIIDDGGYSHSFSELNCNGLSVADIRLSGTQGVSIKQHYTEGGACAIYGSAFTQLGSDAVGGNTVVNVDDSEIYMPVSSAVPCIVGQNIEVLNLRGNIFKLDSGEYVVDSFTGTLTTEGNYVYGGGTMCDTASTAFSARITDGAGETLVGYSPDKSPACELFWDPSRGVTLGSTLRASGTTPPVATLTGTLTSARPLVIEITTGGARGTAVFRWSFDGSSWVSNVLTAATTLLAGTAITVNWPVGTYNVDNVYRGTIAALADQGTKARNLAMGTAANQPVLMPVVRNARPGIQGATTQWLYGSFSKKILQPNTWYVVVQWPSSAAAGRYILDSGTANRQALYQDFGATGKLGFYAGTEVLSSAAIGTSAFALLKVTFRSSLASADIEPNAATETVTQGNANINGIDEVYLGRSSGGGAEWSGYILAVACMKGEMQGEEDARLRHWFRSAFTIAGT